jgi:hypothetical protein
MTPQRSHNRRSFPSHNLWLLQNTVPKTNHRKPAPNLHGINLVVRP